MALGGGKSTQRNIWIYMGETKLCGDNLIPQEIFQIWKPIIWTSNSTFKNNLPKIIGDICVSRKLVWTQLYCASQPLC